MSDISVRLNGHDVRPGDLRTDRERALMDNALSVMREAARFRCPAHRQTAVRIAANGASLVQLEFFVDGCCRILEGVLQESLKTI